MIKKLSLILAGISALLIVVSFYRLHSYKQSLEDISLAKGRMVSGEISDYVGSILNNVMQEGRKIADSLSSGDITEKGLLELLETRSNSVEAILGITAAFEPFQFDTAKRLFAPYYDKNKEGFIFIENVYDYTDKSLETSQWYVKVIENGSQWVEPYYAEGAKAMVADYGMPIFRADGRGGKQAIGTVTMTISLSGFADMLHSVSLGKTGYGFVVSKEEKILAHPADEFIGRKTLKQLAGESESKGFSEALAKMQNGSSGIEDFESPVGGGVYLIYNKIESSGWKIGLVFYKQELAGKPIGLKRIYIDISIAAGMFLLFLSAYIFKLFTFTQAKLWKFSIALSIILLASLIYAWILQFSMNYSSGISPPVTDKSALNRIIRIQAQKAEKLREQPHIIIPTGIYFQKLEFDGAYEVNASGYIWQKIDTSLLGKITPGISFPQASPFAEAVYISQSYNDTVKNSALIGWDFRLALRMNFDYSDYPFDNKNIDIAIKPKSKKGNIMLAPALESYNILNPGRRPGISGGIELPGYEITETYFNYKPSETNTDFGFGPGMPSMRAPTLNFNIGVRRNLINAFVSHLIPILVAMLLIFILIHSSSKAADMQRGKIGIVESLAAFFFVLIFSHIDLRKTVEATQIMYIEYYYFASYFMLVLSAYNLITYTRRDNVFFFDYKDNLIVKVTFWPVFLAAAYLITLLAFY